MSGPVNEVTHLPVLNEGASDGESEERNARITMVIHQPPLEGLLAFSETMILYFSRNKRGGDKFIDNALENAQLALTNARSEKDAVTVLLPHPQLDFLVDYIEQQIGLSFPRAVTASAKETYIAIDALNRFKRLSLEDKKYLVSNPDEFFIEEDVHNLTMITLATDDPEYKASLPQETVEGFTGIIISMKSNLPDIGYETKAQKLLDAYLEALAIEV